MLQARLIDLTLADCQDYYGHPQPGPHIALWVRDTGTGLSPEVQRRLFSDLFFTTKAHRRGRGLAVAYGLVSANHGGLRLDNGPGQGVVAEVVLPTMAVAMPVEPDVAPRGEKVLVGVEPT